jgi:hypothetical protein
MYQFANAAQGELAQFQAHISATQLPDSTKPTSKQ